MKTCHNIRRHVTRYVADNLITMHLPFRNRMWTCQLFPGYVPVCLWMGDEERGEAGREGGESLSGQQKALVMHLTNNM